MSNENTDWQEFDAQLLKVHSVYINPAVEGAVARARARLVRHDLQHELAASPEADVVLEWRGALRQEAHTP
jgi:hypothetical protein